jgi:hypothetical protein
MATKLESLQNAVQSTNVEGLQVEPIQPRDKRKKAELFLLSLNRTCLSPVLDYDKMNHFLLGFSKALKINH